MHHPPQRRYRRPVRIVQHSFIHGFHPEPHGNRHSFRWKYRFKPPMLYFAMDAAAHPRVSFRTFVTPSLHRHYNTTAQCRSECRKILDTLVLGGCVGKNKVLPARFELAIFGLLPEFQAHTDYETDALPTEPRKHCGDSRVSKLFHRICGLWALF